MLAIHKGFFNLFEDFRGYAEHFLLQVLGQRFAYREQLKSDLYSHEDPPFLMR